MYVYILRSELNSDHHYIGSTENLKARLVAHNAGKVAHTKKFIPWKINTALRFSDRQKAIDFEKYLKTGSGRAFSKKHF